MARDSTFSASILSQKPRVLKEANREMPRYAIRWVIAHEPISTFERAAKRFSELVAKATQGRVDVQVFSGSDYLKGKRMTPNEALRLVASGELEMCQTYTSALGELNRQLWVLDLPFLFRNHGHAAGVLDGKIGERLMAGLRPEGMRGLAFTYSGGYRIIATTGKELQKTTNFEGLKIRTYPSPVPKALFETLGAQPVQALLDEIPALARSGKVEAAETTYPRFWHQRQDRAFKSIYETYHSLLLTMLVINEKFFLSLPKAYQMALKEAAMKAAQLERRHSLKEGDKVKRLCVGRGMKIERWASADIREFQDRAEKVYTRFAPQFGKALIQAIQAA